MKLFGNWRKESLPEEQPPFAGESANESATPSIGQGRKVLVVDDNPVVLKAFEMKLASLGFEVITATDGSGAVSRARTQKPDVMVLDVNFPPDVGSTGLQWDGFNIMQWMKRFQDAANIPVIIITSGEPAKLKEKAIACGAVAFFQKPINNEEFIVTLRRVIGQPKKTPAPANGATV